MRDSPCAALSALLVLAFLVALSLGVHAEVGMEQRPINQFETQAATGLRAEADLYCYLHQGDGCWSAADGDNNDLLMAARNTR